MAHSYFHAKSSAVHFGGVLEDYLPIHSWFDSTKQAYADLRHRAVLHNDVAIDIAKQIFGEHIVNADGEVVSVVAIGQQHMLEDLGCIPSLEDWLDRLPLNEEWMQRGWQESDFEAQTMRQAEVSAKRFGGGAADYLPIHEFLDQTVHWYPDVRHRAILHSSFGIFVAERKFGVTIRNSIGREVPTRVIAEGHVILELGHIPTMEAWLKDLPLKEWMVRNALPLSRTLMAEAGAV